MTEIFDREKIQNKIKKLLSLAGNNPNKEEAQAAFLKAQELLLQYKLEMNEIDGKIEEVKIIESVSHEAANTPWARQLARIFADNFACLMFYRKFGGSHKVVYFGEEENASTSCGMYDYAVVWLNKAACNYATMMRNKHGIVKGVKQDYILGFLMGLEDKFKDQVKTNSQYALVVVVPPKVKEEYNKLSLKRGSFSNNMQVHGSKEAQIAGYQAGKTFQTNLIGGKKMNNASVWQSQMQEWTQVDSEGLQKFLYEHRRKAYKSYPDGVEVKYCSICNEPLIYDSMSYYEGYHFDSCL